MIFHREQPRPLRVALACPGVGLVQRGFERLFIDLHGLLRAHCEATLFKGGGNRTDDERVLRFLPRGGAILRQVPLHKLLGGRRTPMHVECLTFALALLPHLVRGRFDVVHTIDPPLARLLFNLRSALGLNFRLLYTEGCAMPPRDYPPADHLHQISSASFHEAVKAGVAASRMTVLPCGVHAGRVATTASREEIRARHGIPAEGFVILSVAALNRKHKRTDYLIEEVSRLPDNAVLWLDGSLDHGEPELVQLARQQLGDRCLVTHVPSGDVAQLFKAADLFAHSATFEAFGIAIAEAAVAGLPLLIHDAPHFAWLIDNDECRIDMTKPGALSDRVGGLLRNRSELQRMRYQQRALARFGWDRLTPRYLELYDRVARQVPAAT